MPSRAMKRLPLEDLRMRVVTTFLRRVIVLARSLEDEGADYPLAPDLRLAVLDASVPDAADLDAYHALRPKQDLADVRDRLARGDLCFAVAAGERMVHATWASSTSGPLPYLDADAVLENGDVVLYDSYTAPAWRGRDLSRSRDELCRRHYRAAGMRRTLALIARENVGGLRTAEPLGYRPIGEYGFLRLGPLRRRWCDKFGAEPVPRLMPRHGAGGGQKLPGKRV
jgi:GNAT superfamily N-acetyltransferase